jgi:hypothetical protein
MPSRIAQHLAKRLAEAAFMTGLERNDLVRMCSYAPLLAHVGSLAVEA